MERLAEWIDHNFPKEHLTDIVECVYILRGQIEKKAVLIHYRMWQYGSVLN